MRFARMRSRALRRRARSARPARRRCASCRASSRTARPRGGTPRRVSSSRGIALRLAAERRRRRARRARRRAGSMVSTSARRPSRAAPSPSAAAIVVLPTPPAPTHTITRRASSGSAERCALTRPLPRGAPRRARRGRSGPRDAAREQRKLHRAEAGLVADLVREALVQLVTRREVRSARGPLRGGRSPASRRQRGESPVEVGRSGGTARGWIAFTTTRSTATPTCWRTALHELRGLAHRQLLGERDRQQQRALGIVHAAPRPSARAGAAGRRGIADTTTRGTSRKVSAVAGGRAHRRRAVEARPAAVARLLEVPDLSERDQLAPAGRGVEQARGSPG